MNVPLEWFTTKGIAPKPYPPHRCSLSQRHSQDDPEQVNGSRNLDDGVDESLMTAPARQVRVRPSHARRDRPCAAHLAARLPSPDTDPITSDLSGPGGVSAIKLATAAKALNREGSSRLDGGHGVGTERTAATST